MLGLVNVGIFAYSRASVYGNSLLCLQHTLVGASFMHSCASIPKAGAFPVESGEEKKGKGKGPQVWIPQLLSQAFLNDLSASEVGHIGRWRAKEKRGVLGTVGSPDIYVHPAGLAGL